MRGYGTVYRRFWRDPDVAGWSEDARHFALYLLTCPEGDGQFGFFSLPPAIVEFETRWPAERWRAAVAELTGHGFCLYNEAAGVALICKALKYDAPLGEKQAKGALRSIVAVGDAPDLFAALWKASERYAPSLFSALRARYPSYGVSEGVSTCPVLSEPGTSAVYTAETRRLSELLAALMLERNERARTAAHTRRWLDPIRLLLDRDGYSPAEVEHVIRWAQGDEFWQQNIRSPAKLREQFDRLYERAGQLRDDDAWAARMGMS
jgi:hypothetical protein